MNKLLLYFSFFLLFVSVFFRLYQLNQVPVALFSDEVDMAYQIQAFTDTGYDYQGKFPLQFHSFADVRTPLSIYSSYALTLFGVSIADSVRLAPAIFGLLSLLVLFFVTRELLSLFGYPQSLLVSSITCLFLSVSPWHFTYSRTGFEVSLLMFFGLTAALLYLLGRRLSNVRYILGSFFLLGLTPAIYSTAKFLLVGYFLLLYPIRRQRLITFISAVLLVLPMFVLTLNGGVSQRFNELAIFTDPTTDSSVDYMRELDLGPDKQVGSQPDLATKLAHNKLTYWGSKLIYNLVKPLSFDYLFLTGDPNLRHALPEYGMLPLATLPILVLGIIAIFQRSTNFFIAFVALTFFSILPSALTRDGATHATRNFPLLIPLILAFIFGLTKIRNQFLIALFLICLSLNSLQYFHSYFVHYPYQSEQSFHAPLRQIVEDSTKFSDVSVVFTRQYEPALIFYLFYSKFPVSQFQDLMKSGEIYDREIAKLNLEGVKLRDTNIYFASLKSPRDASPLMLKPAVYYLTESEISLLGLPPGATVSATFKLPSGLPLISRVDYF